MGWEYFDAEAVAKDCVRRGWVELAMESVRLTDEGRAFAYGGSA